MPAAARIKCPNTNLAKPPVSNSPNPEKAKYQQQDRRHLNIFRPTKETIANFRTSGTLSHTYFNVSRAKCEPSTLHKLPTKVQGAVEIVPESGAAILKTSFASDLDAPPTCFMYT